MKDRFLNALLAAVSAALAFVVFEAAYRYYLLQKEPGRFIQGSVAPERIGVFNPSPWLFDKDFGFRYQRDVPNIKGLLVKGTLQECTVRTSDDFGGLGKQERWPEGAELKIVVVGDSFTAAAMQKLSWPDYMQEALSARLQKRVAVINLALDGIGVLQMVDIAAKEVPRLAPDLVVVAFITDDLTRARIWRTVATVDGRRRVFTEARPDELPDLRYAVDAALISDKVTMEWCNRKPKPGPGDPVVEDIRTRYRLAAMQASARVDLYALNRAFVVDRIRTGSPFPPLPDGVLPRHQFTSFTQDAQMTSRMKALAARFIIVPLHLAMRVELLQKREYTFSSEQRERSLVKSLEELSDAPVEQTSAYLPPSLDIDAVGRPNGDEHPSAYGMQFYGNVAAEAIARRLERQAK